MRRWLKRLLLGWGALAVITAVSLIFVRPSFVVGESMAPTLQTWDVCLLQRIRHYEPRRGDIVMFRTADDPPLYFIKRVVGLPGETVSIEHGEVKANGSAVLRTVDPRWELEPATLTSNKVLVISENSEYGYTPVATRLVKGRLLWHGRWKR